MEYLNIFFIVINDTDFKKLLSLTLAFASKAKRNITLFTLIVHFYFVYIFYQFMKELKVV